MRKIITTTFLTMDGVMQAPGGPDEDRSGGFEYGGWSFHYWDEMSGQVMTSFMHMPFELLLGKRTYDIFAAYWPTAKTDELIAEKFNGTKKYVISHTEQSLEWKGSEIVTGDVVSKLKQLKEMDAPDLWVHGSGNLIQTLLANGLIDRMHLWICPLTLGGGKRLFAEGTRPLGFKLVGSKVTSKGVFIGTYEPEGEVRVGSFVG